MAHEIPKIVSVSLEEWRERLAASLEQRSAQEQQAYLRGHWPRSALELLDREASERAYARAIKTRMPYEQCLREEVERQLALRNKQALNAWLAGANYDFKPGDEIKISGQNAVVASVTPSIHGDQFVEVRPARGLYRLSNFGAPYVRPVEDPDLVSVKDALWPAYLSSPLGEAVDAAKPTVLFHSEVEDKPGVKDEIKPELLRKRVSEW